MTLKLESAWKLAEEARRPEPFLAGLMNHRSVGFLISDPFAGKTLLSLDLSLSVATGQPFLGTFQLARPEGVIYLALDSPPEDIGAQIRGLAIGNGYDLGEVHEHLSMMVSPRSRPFDILSDGDFEGLVESLQSYRPKLLVIDCLSEVCAGDENDRSYMRAVLRRFYDTAERCDVTILVLHHTPIAQVGRSKQYVGRGSSALAAAADFQAHLVRVKGEPQHRKVYVNKSRGTDADGANFTYRIVRVPHPIERAVRMEMVETQFAEDGIADIERAHRILLGRLSRPARRTDLQVELEESGVAYGAKAYSIVTNALTKFLRLRLVERREFGVWQRSGVENGERLDNGATEGDAGVEGVASGESQEPAAWE